MQPYSNKCEKHIHIYSTYTKVSAVNSLSTVLNDLKIRAKLSNKFDIYIYMYI